MSEYVESEITAALPSTLVACIRFYTAMRSRAEPAVPYPIYDGHPTALFRELGYSINDYARILRRMLAMGCIEVLQRGNGRTNSKWALVDEPTLDAFAATATVPKKPSKSRMDTFEDRLLQLEERVSELQRKLE